MSADRARKALRGEPTDRIPLFETPLHPGFLRKLDVDMLLPLPGQTTARETDANLYHTFPVAW